MTHGFDDMSAARSSFDSSARGGEGGWMDSFIAHCEQMQRFLHSHIAWRAVWTAPIDEMLIYDVRYNLMETGGITKAVDETDWMLLLPLRRVTRRHFVSN